MLRQIQKVQFIVGIFLLLQLLCPMWKIPFHLLAAVCSIIVICWKNTFKVLQIQYHIFIIGLYFYRLWLFSIKSPWCVLELAYICILLYLAIMILLCSIRAIL